MNNLPPLPPIEGDLILDVFTRRSSNDSDHCTERLAELGNTVLSMIIMYILFQQSPILSGADLHDKHDEFMDDDHIKQWLTCYNLKSRVRGLDDRSVLDSQREERLLFSSYVGAVYIQKGLPVLLGWVNRLVCPETEPLVAPGSVPPPPYTSTTLPSVALTLPSTAPPSTPPMPTDSMPPVSTLALFNQTCTQRGLAVNWQCEADGPAHQPRWAVKCFVNGQSRGTGAGRNQKVAKEEAARQAFLALGWGNFQ